MTCPNCDHDNTYLYSPVTVWQWITREKPSPVCAAVDDDDIGNGMAGGNTPCGCGDPFHR